MPTFGGAPKCPRCSKSVYAAEEVKCSGKSYHQGCFLCKTCGKGLDSMNVAEGGDDIYCKNCHLKEFGPKGFRGGGGGVNSTTGINDPVQKTASAPSGAGGGGAGKFCSECGVKQTGGKFCSGCGAKQTDSGASASSSISSSSTTSVADNPFKKQAAAPAAAKPVASGGAKKKFAFGGAPKCGACGKSVYEAEKVMGAGKAWHQQCFLCSDCKRGLDSTTLCEKDGQLFCKSCYGKRHGPKGFGIGGHGTHTE